MTSGWWKVGLAGLALLPSGGGAVGRSSGMLAGDGSYVIKVHGELSSFEKKAPEVVSLEAGERQNAFMQHTMTGKNGARFECFVPRPGYEPPRAPAEGGASGDGDGAAAALSADAASNALQPLSGQCAQLSAGFWWYEVCPFAKANQYHMEGKTRSTVIKLGAYAAGEDSLELAHTGEGGVQMRGAGEGEGGGGGGSDGGGAGTKQVLVQKFGGGEGERTLLARWSCGSENKLLRVVEAPAHTYTSYLDSPLLCSPAHVSALLVPLRSSCVRKAEGWWTHEVCFGARVRQYHKSKEGAEEQEHVIGKFNEPASAKLEASGDALVEETLLSSGAADADTVTAFVQVYSGGDVCDLTGEPRVAKVMHHCASGHAPYISGVREVRSCEYEITVAVPSLCAHPKMQPSGGKLGGDDGDDGDSQSIHCLAQAEWAKRTASAAGGDA